MGTFNNLFFIDHKFEEFDFISTQSKANKMEAEMVIRLCAYILRQGYQASQVTILTLYNGQLFTIRQMIRSNPNYKKDAI